MVGGVWWARYIQFVDNANDLLKFEVKMLCYLLFPDSQTQKILSKCHSVLIAYYTKKGIRKFLHGQDLHSLNINYGARQCAGHFIHL